MKVTHAYNCAGCGREGVKGIYCPDCLNSKGREVAHILKLRQLNLFDHNWSKERFEGLEN